MERVLEPKDAESSRYRDPNSIKWKFVDENEYAMNK
jgi:hypothetical protein